jgi:hypothetical protein
MTAKKRERGAVAVIGAVMMVGLFAFAGLAVDVGYLQMMRLRAQAAADAAAEAALFELKDGNTDLSSAGQHDAALNGFTNGQNSTTVTINNPPTLGSYAGSSNAVEAIVVRSVPTFFMGILNFKSVTVQGYASGMLPSAALGCIYALDPTASESLQVAGSTATFNCGAIVESSSSSAFEMEGADTLYMGQNSTLSVVGPSSCAPKSPALTSGCGLDMTGQTQVCPSTGACNSSTYPTANGITSPGDPLSKVAAPTMTGMTTQTTKATTYDNNTKPASNTFLPGVYCGGLTVNNTTGITFTMNPGVYVMAGGGFTLQSNAVVTGTGVTIYNTSAANVASAGGPSCAGSPSFSPMNINGQAIATLTAPTTGSLAGILFFEDRSLGSASTQNQIVGSSTVVMNGALYFKNSELLYSGNGSATGYTMLVADKIVINGNSATTIYLNNSPLSGSGTARAIPLLGQ